MKQYLKLDKAGVTAFLFKEREKDYGGIHLGVPTSSTEILLALTDELAMLPPGHSRSLSLLWVPDDLPRHIAAQRAYQSLDSLRIGTAVNSVTRIQINSGAGIVTLSPHGLAEFKSAITLMHGSHGDLLIAGDSELWTDRLWFWPLEH